MLKCYTCPQARLSAHSLSVPYLIPAPPLMAADLQIGRWRWRRPAATLARRLRKRWQRRLASPLCLSCAHRAQLGLLALSMLASADVLLAPLPLAPGALRSLSAGLEALARALSAMQTEVQITAQALGQTALPLQWRRLAVLPTRARQDAAALLASYAAKLGPVLLPAALPEIPQIANGTTSQFLRSGLPRGSAG